jgi:hypothetical protein
MEKIKEIIIDGDINDAVDFLNLKKFKVSHLMILQGLKIHHLFLTIMNYGYRMREIFKTEVFMFYTGKR